MLYWLSLINEVQNLIYLLIQFHSNASTIQHYTIAIHHGCHGLKLSAPSQSSLTGIPPAPPLPHMFTSSMETTSHLDLPLPGNRIPRAASSNTISSNLMLNSVYKNVWKILLQLSCDPDPGVSRMAKTLVDLVRNKVCYHTRGFQSLELGKKHCFISCLCLHFYINTHLTINNCTVTTAIKDIVQINCCIVLL